MLKYCISISLLLFPFLRHPFHVSVCEINYNESTRSLEITDRLFLDDLEKALRENSGNKKLDITAKETSEQVNDMLKDYFGQQFAIVVNGKKRPFVYLGNEIEEDVMICYLEVEKVRNIKTIEITNTLLFETFDDQANIVHIQKGEKIKSLKLAGDEISGLVEF